MVIIAIAVAFFTLGFFTHDPIKGAFHASRGQTRVVTLRDTEKARRKRGPRKPRVAVADHSGEAGA